MPRDPSVDVSVVIAAYNAEAFLADAVSSALSQRNCRVEIVVVDDGSADGTVAAAEAFGDPRIRVERLPANAGPAAARNRGLDLATGRYVAILDADDAMEPDRLSRLMSVADAGGADVVLDNPTVIETSGEARPMFDGAALSAIPQMSLADFIQSNRLFASRFNYGYMKPLISMDFLQRHQPRYDTALRIGEDYAFMAQCMLSGAKVLTVPWGGYLYRIRPGSISRVLTVADIVSIRNGDRRLLEGRRLDAETAAVQKAREANLADAEAFVRFVEDAKAGRSLQGLLNFTRRPAALRYLAMPISVRLKRLFGSSGGTGDPRREESTPC